MVVVIGHADSPDWQFFVLVRRPPSSTSFPSGTPFRAHAPVAGSQVPASWHWSAGAQVTGFVPLHSPAWQVSVRVQALPSLQAAPSGFAGFEHAPVAGAPGCAAGDRVGGGGGIGWGPAS